MKIIKQAHTAMFDTNTEFYSSSFENEFSPCFKTKDAYNSKILLWSYYTFK